MIQTPNSKKSQILLLLPSDWVSQLDALAESRFTTRLSLIRRFLRIQMDSELTQLSAHFQQLQQQNRTCEQLRSFLDERDY